jgi:hypothetical protein
MQNASISLKATRIPVRDLLSLAVKIHVEFTRHASAYPMPKPAMTVFLLHILKLKKAIVEWGPEGRRGGRKEHDAMMTAAKVVIADLRRLAAYAQSTKPNDSNSWRAIGFTLRLPKIKTQPLQKVRDFRRVISRNIPEPAIKLRWKRPLGAKEKNVKLYIIQRSNLPVYPVAEFGIPNVLGLSTGTLFIDNEPMAGANYYWVTPLNGAGMGVTSEVVLYMAPNKI